jgi:hypothetical protein
MCLPSLGGESNDNGRSKQQFSGLGKRACREETAIGEFENPQRCQGLPDRMPIIRIRGLGDNPTPPKLIYETGQKWVLRHRWRHRDIVSGKQKCRSGLASPHPTNGSQPCRCGF